MIVMSKAARAILNKMQEYCQTVEYDMADIEWYAHNHNLSALTAWWKAKKKRDGCIGDSHLWYLPKFGSEEYDLFLGYIKRIGSEKWNPLELHWTGNHKQVYHYLCANVLTCDFNLSEFKMVLDIGSEFSIEEVQHAAEKSRGNTGSSSVQYILATLNREKQAKEVKAQRVDDAIRNSQKLVKNISSKKRTTLEVAVMRMSFKNVIDTQKTEREMDAIADKRFKRGH